MHGGNKRCRKKVRKKGLKCFEVGTMFLFFNNHANRKRDLRPDELPAFGKLPSRLPFFA